MAESKGTFAETDVETESDGPAELIGAATTEAELAVVDPIAAGALKS